jgi:hypothetical protein
MENFGDKFHKRHHYHEHVECLGNHLAKFFTDEETTVFHELLSLDFHLDVYFIKPLDREYNILLTSGMSLLEMTVDADVEDRRDYLFAELMVLLPKELELSQVHTGEEKNSWIVSMLKQTARFPHHYDTFISIGHTLQATEDMKPYSNETDFVGSIILPSATFDSDFTEFICGDNKINILSVFPIYRNELEFKIKKGYDEFIALLIKANAEEIINNDRKNLISKKNLWDIFKN